ncbi:uncharacterized protein Triagg1_7883 [Trichoderma aggressivum f. europaeum]|uniref:Uncharacterized protein n=1 Tax=Trichoderma aggressivum f. europaeum TaxID=173218 RepID=A0AAE1LWK2_9HYPO|nr:hypothetical protein Triagg1_7883 [Trichoderma aggressivum f. europaeum]
MEAIFPLATYSYGCKHLSEPGAVGNGNPDFDLSQATAPIRGPLAEAADGWERQHKLVEALVAKTLRCQFLTTAVGLCAEASRRYKEVKVKVKAKESEKGGGKEAASDKTRRAREQSRSRWAGRMLPARALRTRLALALASRSRRQQSPSSTASTVSSPCRRLVVALSSPYRHSTTASYGQLSKAQRRKSAKPPRGSVKVEGNARQTHGEERPKPKATIAWASAADLDRSSNASQPVGWPCPLATSGYLWLTASASPWGAISGASAIQMERVPAFLGWPRQTSGASKSEKYHLATHSVGPPCAPIFGQFLVHLGPAFDQRHRGCQLTAPRVEDPQNREQGAVPVLDFALMRVRLILELHVGAIVRGDDVYSTY